MSAKCFVYGRDALRVISPRHQALMDALKRRDQLSDLIGGSGNTLQVGFLFWGFGGHITPYEAQGLRERSSAFEAISSAQHMT